MRTRATYKVICELESGKVRVSIFEVDNDETFVFVCREEERRFTSGNEA
jgi:hypothetical protein